MPPLGFELMPKSFTSLRELNSARSTDWTAAYRRLVELTPQLYSFVKWLFKRNLTVSKKNREKHFCTFVRYLVNLCGNARWLDQDNSLLCRREPLDESFDHQATIICLLLVDVKWQLPTQLQFDRKELGNEGSSKMRERWESNPDRLGVKRERYLCAMPTPRVQFSVWRWSFRLKIPVRGCKFFVKV